MRLLHCPPTHTHVNNTITHTTTGIDEEWFRLVHVSIEAAAGPAIAALRPLQAAVATGDEAAAVAHLGQLHAALKAMQALLGRMVNWGAVPQGHLHSTRTLACAASLTAACTLQLQRVHYKHSEHLRKHVITG